MSVNGINGSNGTNQTQQTSHSPLMGTQSGTVGTQTGAPEPTEENVPVVDTAEEGTGDGSVPSPSGSGLGYGEVDVENSWLGQNYPKDGQYGNPILESAELQKALGQYETDLTLLDQLDWLAEHGDAQAAQYASQLRAALPSEQEIEKMQERLDDLSEFVDELDANKVAAYGDVDGDGVTNEAELQNLTNPFSIDTDGDGITDGGELELQHIMGFEWMDPTNGDANFDGKVDRLNLPSSIAAQYTVGGNSGTGGGGSGGTGGTSGTGGASTTGANLLWDTPAADAQKPTWGGTADAATGDTVFTFNNENVEFSLSEDFKDLIIKNKDTGETCTIQNYKDGRTFLEGTTASSSFYYLSASSLGAVDENNDGKADKGVHIASGVGVTGATNVTDPFNGSVAIDESAGDADTTVYEADGASGTFTVPSEIGGQPVTSIILTKEDFDGDGILDVIAECKASPDGPTLHKFVLKGGVGAVEAAASGGSGITFQLDDKGQYSYSEDLKVHVIGGKGDDYITGKAGSWIEGGDGSDVLRLSGTEDGGTIDGGRGDDYIEGSDGDDTLLGGEGEGMDLLTSNDGADIMNSGDGDDILVSSDQLDTVDGGGGQDMTNIYQNAPSNTEVEVTLTSFMEYLAEHTNEASGALLEALTDAAGLTELGQEAAAEAIANATSSLLSAKKAERYNSYGGSHDNVPPPEDEEPAGP